MLSGEETLEDTMKATLIAAVACLSLVLVSDAAFAQSKKQSSMAGKCTTGQSCAANCNTMGWCSRMSCNAGKWEKRLVGCFGNMCGPKCS